MSLLHVVRSEIHDFLSSYTREELIIMLAAAGITAVVLIALFGVELLSFLLMHFRGWRL